jgi:UDP-3-O-[3-hydroxymyristoyl] glucosamine N-acyltransferase
MIKLNKIIQWAEDNNLIYKLNPNHSITHLIESPWNIKESDSHNISFITKGWIDNNAGVVFATEAEEYVNSLLVIITVNPKYYFAKCINKFFKPNKCVVTTGKNVQIGKNCSLGNDGFQYMKGPEGDLIKFPHFGNIIIEDDVEIANNVCVDRGALSNTIIRRGVKIDNLVHIAHNVEIGENTMIIALAMVAGSVKIGKNCWISPSSCIREQLTIGDNVLIGMGSVVIKDVDSNSVMIGNPAKLLRKQ